MANHYLQIGKQTLIECHLVYTSCIPCVYLMYTLCVYEHVRYSQGTHILLIMYNQAPARLTAGYELEKNQGRLYFVRTDKAISMV